jgi:hypothetical protein
MPKPIESFLRALVLPNLISHLDYIDTRQENDFVTELECGPPTLERVQEKSLGSCGKAGGRVPCWDNTGPL